MMLGLTGMLGVSLYTETVNMRRWQQRKTLADPFKPTNVTMRSCLAGPAFILDATGGPWSVY